MDGWNRASLELAMGASQAGVSLLTMFCLWHLLLLLNVSLALGCCVSMGMYMHQLFLHTETCSPCGQGCPYMQVSMALTPDGRADAVKQMPDGQRVFALPATERRPFPDFIQAVVTPKPGEIVYAQSQNNR